MSRLTTRGFAPRSLLVLLALFTAGVTRGADLRSVTVNLVDGRYHLVSEAWFDASRDDLYRVLTDYSLFEKFSSTFVETRNEPADDAGRPRFFTRMEGCVLLFCKSFRRDGYLLLHPPDEIVAVSDPALSDFKYSHERWRLEPDGDGTVMIYDFQMEPSFWVPPVIGPYIIKRTLRDGGADAIDRIEALAQGKEPQR